MKYRRAGSEAVMPLKSSVDVPVNPDPKIWSGCGDDELSKDVGDMKEMTGIAAAAIVTAADSLKTNPY